MILLIYKAIRDLPLLPSKTNPKIRRHQAVKRTERPESREEWLRKRGGHHPAVYGISREMNQFVEPPRRDGEPVSPPKREPKLVVQTHPELDKPLQRKPRQSLFEKHYDQFDGWAWESVYHQVAKGQHIRSLDDAYMAGMEEAFRATKRYDKSQGELAPFVRPAIKFGIIKHMIWERSRGVTGTRDIEAKYYAARTAAEREKVVEEFPSFEALADTEPVLSTEEAILGAQAMLNRNRNLQAKERRTNKKLAQVLSQVEQTLWKREAKKKTWKGRSLVKRNLRIFELKMVEQMSYGEIAKKLKMDRGEVAKQYKEIVAEIRMHWTGVIKALARSMKDWLRTRLALNLKRLIRARNEGYPEEYVEFVRDACVGILEELGEGAGQEHAGP